MGTQLYTHPGYLYQITKKNKGAESMIKQAMGLKEKEQSLYLYLTSPTSTTNPFNNMRLKSVMNDVDVVVFDTPPEKNQAQESKLNEFLQKAYSVETLSRINTALSQSLKSRNVDLSEVDQKIGNDPKKLALGVELKVIILLYKNFKNSDSKPKLQGKPESLDAKPATPPPGAKQRIHDKAEESKKVIEYIDQRDFIEQNKELLVDKGLFETVLCTFLTDKELTKEIMSISPADEEAWNSGTVKEVDESKIEKHPTIANLEEKFGDVARNSQFKQIDVIAKKINECFETKKNALLVIEKEPSAIKYLNFHILASCDGHVNIKGPIKEPTGCFWKIKKNDKTVGYLLGSIHLTPNHLHDLNSRIRKCFEKSKTLAVEIDITKDDIIKASHGDKKKREFEQLGKYSNDQIENICTVLKKVFPTESEKINFNNAEKKNEFIVTAISSLKRRMYTELKLHSGIDHELINQAKKAGKPVEDLETVEQYKQQESTSKEEETDHIKEALLNFLSTEELNKANEPAEIINFIIEQCSLNIYPGLKPMFDAWEEGNLEGFNTSKKDSVEEKIVMTQRNMNIAMKIVKMVNERSDDKEKDFYCIGAAHTVGEMSVPAFLSNFGLTTERVFV